MNEQQIKARAVSFFYWWFMERGKYVEKGTPLTAEQGYEKYLKYVEEHNREF